MPVAAAQSVERMKVPVRRAPLQSNSPANAECICYCPTFCLGDEFNACVYSGDPEKPMARFKASWENAKRDAKIECRFHDLRHTAISRMIDAGVPLPKVAKIIGWAPATMVRMAARYGHFNLESIRDAVGTINRGEFRQESPVFPPVSIEKATQKIN